MISKYLTYVGVASVIFLTGYTTGYWQHQQGQVVEQLKTQVRVLQKDAVQAQKDEHTLERYAVKIRKLRDELSDKSRVCFDEPDAHRVRDLWSTPG